MNKIKVAIVDDCAKFRIAIRRLISTEPDLVVIIEAENGIDFLSKLEKAIPDVTLMDIRMPKMDGIETTIQMKNSYPNLKVIAYSQYDNEQNIIDMNIQGVKSFIGKEGNPDELFTAIRAVHEGGVYMTDKAATIIQSRLTHFNSKSKASQNINATDLKNLSSKELEILEQVANHKSMKEIAIGLDISPNTVNNHLSNLRKKLSLVGRSSLLQYALKLKKEFEKNDLQ